MSVQSRPKSHHFVPTSYLRRFADKDGFLHVYDSRRAHLRRQRPQKIMKIDAYYRQAWAPSGIDVDIFEATLGGWLEAKAPPVFDKLALTDEVPTEDEATTVLLYVELQRIRVPRQAAVGVELMRSTVASQLPEHIAKRVTQGELQIEMKESARFDYMRMSIGSIHPWLARMEWEIVSAEQGSQFITTDSPVSFYNPRIPPPAEAGIGLVGTKVFFPLSSTHLLLMRHRECRSHHPLEELPELKWESIDVQISRGTVWPKATVEATNWKMAMLAHEMIAGANPHLLRATKWKDIASLS